MPANTSFRFINSYSGYGIKQDRDTRRDVRSYVARVSHTPVGGKSGVTRLKGDKHRSTVVFDVEITSFQDDENDSPPDQAPTKKKLSRKSTLPSSDDDVLQPYLPNEGQPVVPYPDGTAPPPYPGHRISPFHVLSTHTATPLANLAVYHKPFMPAVMHNYVTKLALPIPELDDGSPHPVLRTVWLPMVMHDPAIFQVIVLFAAAHYATYAEPSHWHTFYAEILSLKQNALKALLSGLKMASAPKDPYAPATKALSNGDEECLIAAIGKMASYEAIYGDAAAYHTHMSAVSRMLAARGGLASLGMNGILARLLRFIDTNSAFLLGTRLYLGNQGVGVCLPRHMPFRLKRFEEMAIGDKRVEPVEVPQMQEMELGSEQLQRREVVGLGMVNVERFVGL